ncbi:MAG: IS200/IS605 family accessory protein TnpB-related protein [Verrucomicrobiota bacterium]|nr:IS200/IS605 family accessory protein TnpB-related protein [Verrucomicrobiota bacterium]
MQLKLFLAKRTIAIKLNISELQRESLCELQETFVQGCNQVAEVAFLTKERNRIRLHHLCYRTLRQSLPKLGSQMSCNVIAKTAACLKALKTPKQILFKRECSVHFDKRTYSLKQGVLSLFTLRGRIRIPLEISGYHQGFLDIGTLREAELVRKGNRWFFHLVLDLSDVLPIESGQAMGVDLGENVLAATSTGKLFGGGALRAQRDQFLGMRGRLQSNGSQSAKRRLRDISGQERRHVKHVNHCIAKQIVLEAQRNGCSKIVMEDLKNIRERIKTGKKLRSRLHRWSFDQLRQFVEYKANAFGIAVQYISPEYTSMTCSHCFSLGTRSKHRFSCPNCGSLQHSDLNASRNILRLGLSADRPTGDVNRRYVAAIGGR